MVLARGTYASWLDEKYESIRSWYPMSTILSRGRTKGARGSALLGWGYVVLRVWFRKRRGLSKPIVSRFWKLWEKYRGERYESRLAVEPAGLVLGVTLGRMTLGLIGLTLVCCLMMCRAGKNL